MQIIKNGTKVLISNGEIKGVVLGACVRGIEPNIYIEYEVVWFVGGSRYAEWLCIHEIKEFVETKKKAGMVDYETDTSKLIG